MPRFHHVNLDITENNVEDQEAFLTDILDLRRVEVDDRLRSLGARWFEDDAGNQVHLSPTPHVALEYGDRLAEIEDRLRKAGIEYKAGQGKELRVVTCTDPAGNVWEFRGTPIAQ
jgi:catechol 2,3-dioxygenase-like lactoylglutathione lyase family enzyme